MRQAVLPRANRAGTAPGLPGRGTLGYQGAGPEGEVEQAVFVGELTSAGGFPHVAADCEAAWQVVRQVIEAKAARNIMLGQGGMVDRLELAGTANCGKKG